MKPDQVQFPASETLFVGEWRVDIAANRIRRGETCVKLESRMMNVLVYLADRPGEVATREALEREVWDGRVVSYDALTACLKKLRKSLGDDTRSPRYIETIAKKGYRLIAPVRRLTEPLGTPVHLYAETPPLPAREILPIASDAAAARPFAHRAHWIAVSVLALGALLSATTLYLERPSNARGQIAPTEADATPSLAVLPFKTLGGDAAPDYLSDGLTADITTALARHAGLFVIAHPSVLDFTAAESGGASHALGVRYILQGTLQRTARRLRVNAQLLDEKTGVQLWAERYDRAMADIFTVQDDIVGNIERALALKISETEIRRAARPYTASVDAYDAFLRGQTHFSHRTPEDNAQARAFYETAIRLDPNFARAYSALALTYTHDSRFGWNADSRDALLHRAIVNARKALELDADLPQAHWVMGHIHALNQSFFEAKRYALQAINLNPNFADAYMALANATVFSGEPSAALPLIRKAMQLNPRYPAQYSEILGQAYFLLGRHEEAVNTLRSAVEHNANLLSSYIFLAAAQAGTGDTEEAKWTIEQARMLLPNLRITDVRAMFPFQKAQSANFSANLRLAGLY